MPKLKKDIAKKVADAESAGFEPIPEGKYPLRLRDVKASEQDGPSGPYWIWEFEIPDDAEEYSGRRFWLNTSLSEKALWKMNETFAAFGATPDTDTDELCGNMVLGYITQRTINQGPRKGELTNSIDRLDPYEDDEDGDEDLL